MTSEFEKLIWAAKTVVGRYGFTSPEFVIFMAMVTNEFGYKMAMKVRRKMLSELAK